MFKKISSLLLATTMVLGLAGCGGSAATDSAGSAASTAEQSTTGTATADTASADKPYAGTTLKVWCPLHENYSGVATNMADTKWYEAVHEATGINIEYTHPATGNEDNEFSLLVASGDYPDIIIYDWTSYPGGAGAAVEDGVVQSLNDEIGTDATPNLNKIIDANTEIKRAIKDSNGDYYAFPTLRGTQYEDNNTLFTSGFFMRGDILKEIGMDAPESIDEWYKVLTAVKAAHPDMVPFMTRTEWMNQIFCPGFDNFWDYYVEDGTVKYGPAEDNHYTYLQEMAKWYKEGLIDPDYLTHTKSSDDRTAMAAGNVFAIYDACGGGASNVIPPLLESGAISDESDIVTTVPVTSTKGQNAKFSKMNSFFDGSTNAAAISSQCKNKDAAVWLLDWMYSEQGHMINNFGVEGESYTMENGEPKFTDEVLKNPNGLSVAQALALYSDQYSGGVLDMDPKVNLQYYSYGAQIDGMTKWTKTDYGKYMYPTGAAVASENSDDFATITNNIKTYREENEAAWITGTKELTEASWNEYLAQLESYGLSKAIQYKQTAYDAYMKS